METLGLKATSINADTLHAASQEGRNLLKEIGSCMWPIVVLSAERLTSKDVDNIVCNENFCNNVVLLGIDETHVLIPWGKGFHLAYQQIGLMHKWLPSHVAVVAETATLASGYDYDALYAALGIKQDKSHCIRLSSECPNVHTVFSKLSHGLNGNQFPDIHWLFKQGIKAVVYC
jgi:superfamily II DNA helicase RecQ